MCPNAEEFRTHPVFELISRRKCEVLLSGKYLCRLLMALGGDIVLDISDTLMGTAQTLSTYVARTRTCKSTDVCRLSGDKNTNGQIFFHSCENNVLYLKALINFIFFEGLGLARESLSVPLLVQSNRVAHFRPLTFLYISWFAISWLNYY